LFVLLVKSEDYDCLYLSKESIFEIPCIIFLHVLCLIVNSSLFEVVLLKQLQIVNSQLVLILVLAEKQGFGANYQLSV